MYTRSVHVTVVFLTDNSCFNVNTYELSTDLRLLVSQVSLEYNIAIFNALFHTLIIFTVYGASEFFMRKEVNFLMCDCLAFLCWEICATKLVFDSTALKYVYDCN